MYWFRFFLFNSLIS
ncbi:hypothetical protein V2J09_000849 [Rumex salicifolius]